MSAFGLGRGRQRRWPRAQRKFSLRPRCFAYAIYPCYTVVRGRQTVRRQSGRKRKEKTGKSCRSEHTHRRTSRRRSRIRNVAAEDGVPFPQEELPDEESEKTSSRRGAAAPSPRTAAGLRADRDAARRVSDEGRHVPNRSPVLSYAVTKWRAAERPPPHSGRMVVPPPKTRPGGG